MPKYLTTLILLFFVSLPGSAQEEEAAGEVADTVPETAAESTADDAEVATESADEEDVDDSDLDEQTYEEDDDDFVPTEEIPADEPIPFPSNI